MPKLQDRTKSKVMIRGIVILIVMLIKNFAGYEVPNVIVDSIIELAMATYGIYAVGNSPRIKGEY